MLPDSREALLGQPGLDQRMGTVLAVESHGLLDAACRRQ